MTVRRGPGRVSRRSLTRVFRLSLALALLAGAALLASSAQAATNASSAAAFIESAQNADGGFAASFGGRTKAGGPSSLTASLWASVALLAAGKNPQDEELNNGASAQDYLLAHLADFHSLTDLGLLAILQVGSGASSAEYGDPGKALKTDMTLPALKQDPQGAAMGVLGLLALKANANARGAADTLLADQDSDGSWGESGSDAADPAAATALVLEALAQTGMVSTPTATTAVTRALKYLQGAQINDGSITNSDENDTTGSGDVAATAFTVEALAALHRPQLRTSDGETVLQGLADYQQQSGFGAGGISPFGAYDTNDPAQITATAEAYPAFDGLTLPLPYVAPVPPQTVTTTAAKSKTPPVNRASNGTSKSGISATGTGPKKSASAYQGASAAGKTGAKAKPHHGSVAPSSGQQVSGTVVGTAPPPKLTSAAGRKPAKSHTALYLVLGLVVVALLGGLLELRRPARHERSAAQRTVQHSHNSLIWFRDRGSVVPAGVAALGITLILIPVIAGLWGGAPKGAAMITAFKPYMRPAVLTKLNGDVRLMHAAFSQTRGLAGAKRFDTSTWPPVQRTFEKTLATVTAQRGHFDSLSALPSLRTFPWFLLIPGVLLLVAAAVALARPRTWLRLRAAVAVIGAALVIAPLTLGLFSAGAQGAAMLSAFASVENTHNVTAMQDGFGTLASGYSVLSDALPRGQDRRYPAAVRFDQRWTGLLGDFTPLLGVMNNNLANYRAVAGLPNFRAFPWLFAIPGLLALALALTGLPRQFLQGRRREPRAHPSTTIEARSHP